MKASVGKRCGDCEHWMKSSDCPREKRDDNKNPSKIGLPTCNSFPCEKFKEQTIFKQKKN